MIGKIVQQAVCQHVEREGSDLYSEVAVRSFATSLAAALAKHCHEARQKGSFGKLLQWMRDGEVDKILASVCDKRSSWAIQSLTSLHTAAWAV